MKKILFVLLFPVFSFGQDCKHYFDGSSHMNITAVSCNTSCCNSIRWTCVKCGQYASVNECDIDKHHVKYDVIEKQESLLRDSINYTFALRDSIEKYYEDVRNIDSKSFDMELARELREDWHFLNYKLKCWKENRPYSWEAFRYWRIKNKAKVRVWAEMIEFLKVDYF